MRKEGQKNIQVFQSPSWKKYQDVEAKLGHPHKTQKKKF